jgi:carotenoid cleavage dioxygenase
VSYSATRGRTVQYSVIDTEGRARRTIDIEVAGAPMMHAFSLTDRYVVIYDLPVTWDPAMLAALVAPRALRLPLELALRSMLGKVRTPGPLEIQMNRLTKRFDTLPFAWNDKYPSRIGVMPRDGGAADVRWFDVEPCFVFHPLNAYSEMQDGVEVLTLDVVRNDRMFVREHRGPADGHPRLDRWTVNLTTGAVRTECRDDRTQEFPRINETLIGAKHRFGYTAGVEGGQVWDHGTGDLRTALYKHDYVTGTADTAPLDPELIVGELVFVPNPEARAEDDGVLMGYGFHRGRDEGQLLILDAQSLEVVATVHLPQRVPMGFHGNWTPS